LLVNTRLGGGSELWYIERIKGEIEEVPGDRGSGFGEGHGKFSSTATLRCGRRLCIWGIQIDIQLSIKGCAAHLDRLWSAARQPTGSRSVALTFRSAFSCFPIVLT
jgi:hypothetical protein